MENPKPILKADGLTKRYEDGQLAVDHLSFKVEPGEIFCMFGANGAGKTTTINLFLGFIPPTSGAALVEGVDVAQDPLKAKRHVAFVSENVMLYGNFTAVQNLDYFSKLAGKRHLAKKDYTEVLARVGLQREAFDRRVKNFSKGMRQKLGIAIAVVKDAANVLLDEPTSGLDPQSGREFLEILVQMRDKGKSVFMSTHDIFRAKLIADRIGFMRKGRLVMLKTAKELAHEDLTDLYIQYMEQQPGELTVPPTAPTV
jgi:ABC-2 type transport system ATP-binding protein